MKLLHCTGRQEAATAMSGDGGTHNTRLLHCPKLLRSYAPRHDGTRRPGLSIRRPCWLPASASTLQLAAGRGGRHIEASWGRRPRGPERRASVRLVQPFRDQQSCLSFPALLLD